MLRTPLPTTTFNYNSSLGLILTIRNKPSAAGCNLSVNFYRDFYSRNDEIIENVCVSQTYVKHAEVDEPRQLQPFGIKRFIPVLQLFLMENRGFAIGYGADINMHLRQRAVEIHLDFYIDMPVTVLIIIFKGGGGCSVLFLHFVESDTGINRSSFLHGKFCFRAYAGDFRNGVIADIIFGLFEHKRRQIKLESFGNRRKILARGRKNFFAYLADRIGIIVVSNGCVYDVITNGGVHVYIRADRIVMPAKNKTTPGLTAYF